MKATDLDDPHVVEGKKQFIIPVFQRGFRWDVEQCLRLWEDSPDGARPVAAPDR